MWVCDLVSDDVKQQATLTDHCETYDAVLPHQRARKRSVLLQHVLSILVIAETLFLIAVDGEAEYLVVCHACLGDHD